jgi:hypothetical protein
MLYATDVNGMMVRELNQAQRERPLGPLGGWVPRCGARAEDLPAAYRDWEKASHVYDPGKAAWEVVVCDTDRSRCEAKDAFTEWHPGLSLAEHQQILERKRIYEREDARDNEMRTREDQRDARVERQQGAMHRRELWIMGGVVTVAIVISTVIASVLEGAISRGWEPSWWPF